ncbi:MAG TPA: pyruvate dehydrogenase complex dihydrolipoamide acetyltransferase, partial [Rhizobiales bacterium]|nr:pyruvate dehydrogenase complex dihydrolipoamide acetyltransferase [Hyphomicrobiales bacterium]
PQAGCRSAAISPRSQPCPYPPWAPPPRAAAGAPAPAAISWTAGPRKYPEPGLRRA